MNYGGRIVDDIAALAAVFAARCSDRALLDEITTLTRKPRNEWKKAKSIFDRARSAAAEARRTSDAASEAQRLFEEICAKTLYNLSGASAAFDADSPYWVVPKALLLARSLDIPTERVIDIVAA